MKKLIQLVSTMALAVTAIAAFAGSASASIGGPFSPGADHVVFVQNNSTTGNQVFAYDRAPTGRSASPARTQRAGSAASSPDRWSTTSRRKGRSPTTTATDCCTP